MKLHAWVIGTSVLFALGGIASADKKYPWCEGIANEHGHVTSDSGDKFLFNSDADDTDNDGALYNVALSSCGSSDAAFETQLTAARARWSKRLELSDADWKDVAAYTTLQQYDRQGSGIERIDLAKRTYESLTPLEQFSLVAGGTKAATGKSLDGGGWMADVLGGRLSETGRLAFLKQCITSKSVVEMAQCAPDAAAFDAHKVFQEMRADASPNGARLQVRLYADRMRREIPKFQARVAALVKQDPAYGTLFDLAAKTAKQWDAMYAAHDPNVDLALQMDDALITNSRKAYDGCAPRTRDAWLKAVSAIPAKRFTKLKFPDEGLPAVLQNPDAYLAGFSMMMCGNDAKDDPLLALGGRIAGQTQRWAGNRGPHTAIISAVIAADLKFDDRGVELKQPDTYREWLRTESPSKRQGGGEGTIAKVTPKGSMLHIDFVMTAGTDEACAEGNFTHRIEAIRSDGTIQYHYDCRKWKTVKTESGSPPIDIDSSFAAGLKAGMKVKINEGIVAAAWPTPKSDTPVIVYGAAVK